MGRRGRLSLGGGDLVLRHSRPRTVGMRGPATAPNLHSGFATVLLLLLLLLTSEVAARREGRILSNPFGLLGHTACSSDESGDGQAVGMMMQDAMNRWITRHNPGWSVLQRGGMSGHGRQRGWLLPAAMERTLQSGAAFSLPLEA